MKGENKYGKPGSSDYLRYIKGEMTGSERNSFERELQRNPFAQDALDGMETISAGEIQNDLGSLKQRIRRRRSRKSRFTYYRIAASVAVLMIISSVFYVVERSRVTEQYSLPEYRQVPLEIEKAEPVRKPETEVEAESVIPPPAADRQPEVVSRDESIEKSGDLAGGVSRETEKAEMQEKQFKAQDKVLNEMPEMVKEAEAARPAAVAWSRAKTDTGILINADSSEHAPVDITITASEKQVNSKESPGSAGYLPPQPSIGRNEYDRYIREHIIRPDSATAGQRVVVVAAFKVLMDGSLDSIKVVRSPEQKFSDEVLRLISTGPAWQPARRNGIPVEDEVTLRIVFR